MLKPHGADCDLNCSYCYYLAKQSLYPDRSRVMSNAVLEAFTEQYLALHPGPEVTFTWQGGEPTLLGVEFFQRAVELQQKFCQQHQRVANSLQTNGVRLNAEWAEFLARHDFLVGVSIDGPSDCHDTYRVNQRGGATLERVMRGMQVLRRHGVRTNALSCVHHTNVRRPLEVYRFLRDVAQVEFVQFIPVVTRDTTLRVQEGRRLIQESVKPEEYGSFLIGVFDEWSRRDIGEVYVQLFDVALSAWVGQAPGLCIFDPICGRAVALEHNGDLYACDHFVEPSHRIGNILDQPLAQLMRADPLVRFGRNKRDRLPDKCRQCRYLFACNGGCPKNRLEPPAGDSRPLNHLCDGYLAFFRHVDESMQFMAQELRARRPPANLMLLRSKRNGRNAPCPCGSGKKRKRCHG